MSVLVIAEPGCTHEGDLKTLLRLVDAAAEAGCDVFKAQWTSNPDLMVARRGAAEYRRFYQWLAFPIEWHARLAAACQVRGMFYACSTYLPDDVAWVDPFVAFHKAASFEAQDMALLDAMADTGKFYFVGTGMLTTADVMPYLDRPRCRLLHCTSSYPAPLSALYLRAIRYHHGLSDHSRHVLTGAVAVGAGARFIEAHFRLPDCNPQNPDYAVAFDPLEFATYVDHIRTAEQMAGDGDKRIQPCEVAMTRYKVRPDARPHHP